MARVLIFLLEILLISLVELLSASDDTDWIDWVELQGFWHQQQQSVASQVNWGISVAESEVCKFPMISTVYTANFEDNWRVPWHWSRHSTFHAGFPALNTILAWTYQERKNVRVYMTAAVPKLKNQENTWEHQKVLCVKVLQVSLCHRCKGCETLMQLMTSGVSNHRFIIWPLEWQSKYPIFSLSLANLAHRHVNSLWRFNNTAFKHLTNIFLAVTFSDFLTMIELPKFQKYLTSNFQSTQNSPLIWLSIDSATSAATLSPQTKTNLQPGVNFQLTQAWYRKFAFAKLQSHLPHRQIEHETTQNSLHANDFEKISIWITSTSFRRAVAARSNKKWQNQLIRSLCGWAVRDIINSQLKSCPILSSLQFFQPCTMHDLWCLAFDNWICFIALSMLPF
jgi:hypothetical protein